MAKVVCVLYDDPVDGYPKSYPRDDLPKIDRYPDGQTLPTPKSIDFKPGSLLGSVSAKIAAQAPCTVTVVRPARMGETETALSGDSRSHAEPAARA